MKCIFTALFLMVSASVAQAQSINYPSLDAEGFGGVSELLQSMTPQQRADIFRQAYQNQKDLQKMSPQDRDELLQQLHEVSDTLAYDKIDAGKLNTKKAQNVADSRRTLNSYQKKYREHKINNPAVINNGQ